MKSAYELAMDRLKKEAPETEISEEMKVQLAELDTLYQSKVAEKEVFLTDLIVKAQAAGNFAELEQLEVQKTREIARLREKCETEKEKIRQGAK